MSQLPGQSGQPADQPPWRDGRAGARLAPTDVSSHGSLPLAPSVPNDSVGRAHTYYTQPVRDGTMLNGEIQEHVDGAASAGRNARFSLPDAVTIPLEHLWRPRTATTLPDTPTVVDLPAATGHGAWLAPWQRERYRHGQTPTARAETHALIGLLVSIGVVLLIVTIALTLVLIQVARFTNTPSSHQAGLQSAVGHSAQPTPTATATLAPTITPQPATSATFVTADMTTLGSWQGIYGAMGYVTLADAQQLPPTIQVTPANASPFIWAASTSDPRGLQKAATPTDRIAACWYSPTSFTIDVNITDGQTYQLALYLVDWDQLQRAQTVDLLDPTRNTLLDSHSVAAFGGGEYLVWKVRGHIALQITNSPGSANAVVSGLFFARG
ncbi:MAG: hypothetical protein ABI068_15770 [Ktedonobacterales bacterium]